MKKLIILICISSFIGTFETLNAQKTEIEIEDPALDFKKRNPIFDYTEVNLNNTDTIPDFKIKEDKLKITGTIYLRDGVTPAKNVILFIYQPDESGDFDLRTSNDKRYVLHRGWIKTDEDGLYTFYTFVPNTDVRSKEIKQIYAVVKEENKEEYEIAGFVFDNDQLLNKSCRKKIVELDPNSILILEKEDNMFVSNRDIILSETPPFAKK